MSITSIITHFSTFLLLFLIGFHRLYSSLSIYLKDLSFYRSKPWFFTDPKWNNIDFYTLLITLPFISLSEFIVFISFSTNPSYKFTFLQHGVVVLLYWVVLIVINFRESYDLFAVNEGFLYVLGGVCFFIEYFINGNGFSGVVSDNLHGLLGNLMLVCAFCCLYLSIYPTAFLADFCLSCGLMLKGTWVLQVGLSMSTHTFGFKGCNLMPLLPEDDTVFVKCDLDEDGLRSVVMMNLLFVWHVIVVLMGCFGLFWLLSCKERLRCSEGNGPLLGRVESHSILLQPLPEIELE